MTFPDEHYDLLPTPLKRLRFFLCLTDSDEEPLDLTFKNIKNSVVSLAKVTVDQRDWTQRVRHVPGTEKPVDGISTKQINSQYQMISPVRSMEQINYLLARCTGAVLQGRVRGGWTGTQCVNSEFSMD
jgi:hypothetical protein